MKRILFFICVFFIAAQIIGQATNDQATVALSQASGVDSTKIKSELLAKKHSKHKKFIQVTDTLSKSDYLMSIDRVNDNLNDIRDSIKLGQELVQTKRRIDEISSNISTIRLNFKDRRSTLNVKNLYLYQSFVSELDDENDRIISGLNGMYKRVSHSKIRIKKVLTDSIFKKIYADSLLRNAFDSKLARLERKWSRTDSTTRANMDSLNQLKIKAAESSIDLTNTLSMINSRLDKADQQVFSQEINYLWQADSLKTDSSKSSRAVLGSERKAISYYFNQTAGQRALVSILGILLFLWLFLKRKLLKTIKQMPDKYAFLQLKYMNSMPVLTLLIIIFSLMPLLDAYAPTSYIAIEYSFLLLVTSVLFFRNSGYQHRYLWLSLVVLFGLNIFTYLLLEPIFLTRLWVIGIYVAIICVIAKFILNVDKKLPYAKWLKIAAYVGIILTVLAVITNVFGRISLSWFFGIAGVFALTQAIILTVFIDAILEVVLLQLAVTRLKKGIEKPFDISIITSKLKVPLLIIAGVLWVIMLASNLNIYHSLSILVVDALTQTRTIGSISFRLTSVLLFIAIIWFAHMLQRLISFLFGETGLESDDINSATKAQHSRLLITRLLVLIGGYLLAIAASGLPIDKLTFLLGALGVGIGMGLQSIVNNFVSGIILIFDGSLQIGDEIEINGQAGKVKEIGLRTSTLSTSEGADVIIPNGNILSQNIVNWTFTNDQKRVNIEFSVFGKELDANVINEIINNTIKDVPNVVARRKPVILYTKVTLRSCTLTVRFWSTIGAADEVKSTVMLDLNRAFTDKNIGFR